MSLEELQGIANRYLDVEIDELMRTILEKTSNMDREQLSRLVRLCRNFYALLEEFVSDDLTEGYMDAHDGMNHVDTLDMMAALRAVVKEYGHMELVTPIRCEMRNDDHGRRLALVPTTNEGLIPDKIVPDKIGGDINLNLDASHSSVGFLGGTANNSNNGAEGDYRATTSHNENLDEFFPSISMNTTPKTGFLSGNNVTFNFTGNTAKDNNSNLDFSGNSSQRTNNTDVDAKVAEVSPEVNPEVSAQVNPEVTANVKADGASVAAAGGVSGGTTTSSVEEDMSELDSHTSRLEDIEFVMTEYIADSTLIEFVKKVDATTWLVGVEDEVVTVKFDPSWSEYVYTIEGKGPYSHRSYEYISRDVYDFVMSQRTGDEYDDDFDDLSAFNECYEVRKTDALYGVEGREDLVEAVYTDTSGIMGVAGETYTTAELRKIWNDNHNDDPSMVKYNGDYDKWVSDTLAQMSRNDDVDEAFDMNYGPDLSKLSWQVASYLDVDALGEDKWIEFICDDPRDTTGGKKSMRFEAIGEDAHMYGFIRTNGDAVDVQFRNGSEAMCHSAEEVARFIAGEFGISF